MTADAVNSILSWFGQRVRELRRARGWSQEAFARHCGLDRSYMGGVERGDRNISLVNVWKIAAALEVDLGELFAGSPLGQPSHAAATGRTS